MIKIINHFLVFEIKLFYTPRLKGDKFPESLDFLRIHSEIVGSLDIF